MAGVCLHANALPVDTAPAPVKAVPVEAQAHVNTPEAIARYLREISGPSAAAATAGAGQLMQQVRDTASDLVLSAMNFLGVPYRRGGTSAESGFDCSGFTRHVFENSVGLLLPRRSRDQARAPELLTIRREDLKPGDLVFFNTMRSAFSHVGIYVGDGKFIHSPRTGSKVRVEDMGDSYWLKRFNGARRAPELQAAGGSLSLSAPADARLPAANP